MQSFEYIGFWWVPSTPEIKWPGTLRFDPVNGAVLKRVVAADLSSIAADRKEFDLLLGESTTGKKITLLNSFERSQEDVYANAVIVGFHALQPDPPIAVAAAVIENLDKWWGRRALRHDDSLKWPDIGVSYQRPQPVEVHADSAIRTVIMFNAIPLFDERGVFIHEEVRFEMTADDPQPLSAFRRRVGACQDLLSVALLTRCNVQVLRICPPTADGKRNVVAEYHAVPVFRDPSGLWVDHLFRFPEIAPRAREVFTAWFENAERLSAVRSLYLSATYGKSFLEIKLLALAQAAEAFHRRFYKGKDCYMQESVYERDVFAPMDKAIPAVVNESHRQSLRGRLRFGNEYSFRKRLTALFEEHAAAMKAVLPNPKSWIEPLVNYRNTLTHHPVAESEQTTNTTELLQCNYVLTMLLELCFLKAMGMDAAQIEKLARDCGRYAQIRERFFEYEVTLTSVDGLTREEMDTCIDVVVEGEAVPRGAAQTGLPQAAKITVVRCKGEIVGVGVIKGPNVQHARTVATEHKYDFPETTPELGYVSVRKAHRKKHLSSRIFEKLLLGSHESLYAVTSDTQVIHLLRKHGFVKRGAPTRGRRGDTLSLWLKAPE